MNSYPFFLHIDPDNFPYEEFSKRLYLHHVADNSEESEQMLIAKFMRQVYDISKRLTSWQNNIDQESQLIKLKNDNICIYCKEETIDSKVFDHDHCRNRYNGPAHSKCNMRANKQKEVPLFFHNATYDVNLTMKYIGRGKMHGDERYVVCADIISTRDSYALLLMELSDLGRQLEDTESMVDELTESGEKEFTHMSG